MEHLERKWWKPQIYIVLCTVIFLGCYLFTGNAAVLLFLGLFMVSGMLTVFEYPKAEYILCLVSGIYFFCFPIFYNSFIPYSAFLFFEMSRRNSSFWSPGTERRNSASLFFKSVRQKQADYIRVAAGGTSDGKIEIKKYEYPVVTAILVLCVFLCSNRERLVYRVLETLYAAAILLFGFLLDFGTTRLESVKQNMQNVLVSAALNQLREENLRKELAIKNQLIERNTRLEERERISRDIHNAAGHTITAGLMALEAAQAVYEKEYNNQKNTLVSEKMEAAHQRVKEGLGEIRKVVRLLNQEDSMTLADCLDSIRILLERFEMDTGVQIRHNLDRIESDTMVDMELAAFLRGSITELVTNGVKHGGAGRFVIICKTDHNHIAWKVIDNGKETAGKTFHEYVEEGFGLKKIYEKVRECGGDFVIDDTEGFTVAFSLPLEWKNR